MKREVSEQSETNVSEQMTLGELRERIKTLKSEIQALQDELQLIQDWRVLIQEEKLELQRQVWEEVEYDHAENSIEPVLRRSEAETAWRYRDCGSELSAIRQSVLVSFRTLLGLK